MMQWQADRATDFPLSDPAQPGLLRLIRDGVPVTYHDAKGQAATGAGPGHRLPLGCQQPLPGGAELKITGLRTPNYNRRADLVCFINGLPLVLSNSRRSKNIRAGFDGI
jgi:type I restriction enzyme R subunit